MATTNTRTQVENALADVRDQLQGEEARLMALRSDLGDALAASRMGDRAKGKRAGSLSMEVTKLNGEIETLKSEERSLTRRLGEIKESEAANARVAAMERAESIKERIESAEQKYADAIQRSWDLAQELQALESEWNAIHKSKDAALKSVLPRRPHNPVRLLSFDAFKQGTSAIDRWLKPVKPSIGIPRVRQDGDPLHQSPVPKQRLGMADFVMFNTINRKGAR